MRNSYKIIIAMVIICLGAYGLSRWMGTDGITPEIDTSGTTVPPRVAAQQAAAKSADTADAADTGASASARLLYPGPAARQALHLDYALLEQHADGSVMVLPLPPGTAWQTMLALQPGPQRQLVIHPTRSECGFAVRLALYRVDRAKPLWQGQLDAHGKSQAQTIDLDALAAHAPLLLTLKMADTATNNWSCNVDISWGGAASIDTAS